MLSLRNKINPELFELYRAELALRYRSQRALKEAYRELGHFEQHLGGYPPSAELAKGFLSRFLSRKTNTLARYTQIIGGFLKWYGDPLDFKVRQPEQLPQVVEDSDIDRIIETMRSRQSHKKKTQRDILLIETGLGTGLRAGELAALRVGDIDFRNMLLVVRRGKGEKDRAIPLLPSLSAKLEAFCGGKEREDMVFALARATISNKVGEWARKAGVPHVHAHSLRHSFGSALARRGVGARTIQQLLGHSNLATSQRYIDLVGRDLREAVNLLDTPQQPPISSKVATLTKPSEEKIERSNSGPKDETYQETSHKQKMQELAKGLIGEISVPRILNSFIVEMKRQRLLYADSRGHILCPPIVINENGGISIELSIDDKGEIDHLHKALCSHLETGGFSELLSDIENWKNKFGQYLADCHSFLKAVIRKIENDKKVKIPLDDKELKTGFTIDFPKMICHSAFCTIAGYPVLTYKIEPHPFHNKLSVLRYGACGIYLAETEEELRNCQRFHENLISEYAGERVTRDLVKEYQELNQLGGQIVQQLEVFRDMEHVRGHCDLCSK